MKYRRSRKGAGADFFAGFLPRLGCGEVAGPGIRHRKANASRVDR
jgi:hypothetical protein